MSNVKICNLAYSGKLDELKESILADKSLATRTDQVNQTEGLSPSSGCQGSPTWLPVLTWSEATSELLPPTPPSCSLGLYHNSLSNCDPSQTSGRGGR